MKFLDLEYGPSTRVITRIESNFEENHTLLDRKKIPHKRHVEQNPKISLLCRSQQLNVSRTSLQRILTVDLKLHPYKIKLTQRLKPVDHEMRGRFVNWSLQMLDKNPEFSKFVIFSDKAHFQMVGYVNKENCRYWNNENPQELQEATQNPEKVSGVDFGGEESLVHTSLKTMMEMRSPLILSATEA